MFATQVAYELPRLFGPPGRVEAAAGMPVRGRPPRRPAPMLLAVDGNALAHRAFHGAGGVEAPAGMARRRFLVMLARVAAGARPTACVVGFDDPVSSLRRDLHPGYKAARPVKAAQLVVLLDELPDLLERLGLCVVVPPGLEADDVLGSAAARAGRVGAAATLATGDRDAFALVSPTVRVWWLRAGGDVEHVSPSWLRARYGVGPAAYPALAALRGDASDCLPGVHGMGEIGAARLLRAYPDVEAALADPAGLIRLLGERQARALCDQRAVYERNRALMAIRTDVDLDLDASARGLDRARVEDGLARVGLPDLVQRWGRAFGLLGRAPWRRAAPPRQPARG